MWEREEGLKTKIILASASPRRKEIFENLGLDFDIIRPGKCKEQKLRDPYRMVSHNSILKVKNVLKQLESQKGRIHTGKNGLRLLISSFDTIVSIKNRSMGKPRDLEEAYNFINMLSGRVHRVISGVCVLDSSNGKCECDTETTEVKFRKLSGDEIRGYLARGDVLDKAGAYNIGEFGSVLVEKINGCFFNVVGVPVFKYINLLARFDYKILEQSKE